MTIFCKVLASSCWLRKKHVYGYNVFRGKQGQGQGQDQIKVRRRAAAADGPGPDPDPGPGPDPGYPKENISIYPLLCS